MTDPLETVEIETGDAPRAAVVWMHGLGADGHDFEPVVPALGLPKTLPVRFVFPHAPIRPVTINNGWEMRAWYDVAARGGPEDEAGLRAARDLVEALLARERARGVPARSLVLAGFSQGGAMALLAGLRHPERLAGILALSCYLPLADALAGEAAAANRDVPILMAHGTYDDVIPIARARASRDRLAAAGYAVDWREYSMPHSVCDQEVRDIGAWLQDVLSNPRPR